MDISIFPSGKDSKEDFTAYFPTTLRKLREEKGASQEAFAKAIGATRSTASLYENGQNKPDIERLAKIAEFYDVSYDYLLGKSESKKRENADINEKLGLSDGAINMLSVIRDYKPNIDVVNELLENIVFVALIGKMANIKRLNGIPEPDDFPNLDNLYKADQIVREMCGENLRIILNKQHRDFLLYEVQTHMQEIVESIVKPKNNYAQGIEE